MSDNGEFYMGIDPLKATSYGRRTTGGTITNYSNPLTLLTFPFNETISHTHGITSTVVITTYFTSTLLSYLNNSIFYKF
jgi:hypothetical protein